MPKHAKKHNNRIPPSVPKCVKKHTDGYCTEFIEWNNAHARFLFKKTTNGYLVYRTLDTVPPNTVCMSTDLSIAPSTRILFQNLPNLTKAISATESWLGKKLPDIR